MPNISYLQENDVKDIYIIEEIKAPEGYQNNNVVYVLIVNFAESSEISGKVQISSIDEKYMLKVENGSFAKDTNGYIALYDTIDTTKEEIGTNTDESNYIIGKEDGNQYRADYSKNTITFTAVDEKLTGSYDVDLLKNASTNMQPIEGLESLGTRGIAGAKYKVTQYLNVNTWLSDHELKVFADFEEVTDADAEITVITGENGKLINATTNQQMEKLFTDVPITDVNTVDIYVIEELSAPSGYFKNTRKIYVQIAKEELEINSTTHEKTFAIKVDEGEYTGETSEEWKIDNSTALHT